MAFFPIDSKIHRNCGWKRFSRLSFASRDVVAPVFMQELPHLIPYYPLAFIHIRDAGYQMAALLGIHPGHNLFLNESGQWKVPYIPACYRSYPFTLKTATFGEESRRVLCFDDQSGLFRETPDSSQGEERFFDTDGQLSPPITQLMMFLNSIMASGTMGKQAADVLFGFKLLVPWEFPFENPDPDVAMVKGLYTVDEKALNSLDGQQFETLRKVNALPMVYAQLLSMGRIAFLLNLHRFKNPVSTDKGTLDLPQTIDSLFGEGNSDTINFDWLK